MEHLPAPASLSEPRATGGSMTRPSNEQVFNLYRERFGVELIHPPLDYGIRMDTDDLARYARRALREGKPIVWSEFFIPLPPDCES